MAMLLLAGNIMAYLMRAYLADPPLYWLVRKFDFDAEWAFPAWYSSSLLTIAAVLAIGIYLGERSTARSGWRWCVAGVLLLAMSADETASVHENLGRVIDERMSTPGVFHFSWVVVALPLLAAAALVFLPWLWQMERATRLGLIGAAALYFGGAVGMVMIGGLAAERGGQDSLAFFLAYTVEESLEILGLSLGVLTLSRLARRIWVRPPTTPV
ncbi:MAG: hypothetical protein AAFX76_01535 [Planctomycetota bacterium]